MVVGHDRDAVEAVLPTDVRIVRNPAYRDGQATSLAAGLHDVAEDSEAAIVLQADQPGITADDVRALIAGFRDDANTDHTPALPRRPRAGPVVARDLRRGRPPARGRRGPAADRLASGVGARDPGGAPAPRDIDTPQDLDHTDERRRSRGIRLRLLASATGQYPAGVWTGQARGASRASIDEERGWPAMTDTVLVRKPK